MIASGRRHLFGEVPALFRQALYGTCGADWRRLRMVRDVSYAGPVLARIGASIEDGNQPRSDRSRFGVLAARIRLPLLYVAVGLVVVDVVVPGVEISRWVTLPVFAVGLALAYRIGRAGGPPVTVRPPVSGRWQAVHTPADKVPSHGLHAYGQTYALDLTVPHDRRSSRWWPIARAPEEFPAFNRPVSAARAGTVVRAAGWQRDHRSRDSLPGIAFVLLEGLLRELLGPSGLLGNHIVLAHDDGTYSTYAHLKRGSLRVDPGQRVEAGQIIAACGNSGNSTEPHLHFQVQDRPSLLIAAGLPVTFENVLDDGHLVDVPPPGRPVEFAQTGGSATSSSGTRCSRPIRKRGHGRAGARPDQSAHGARALVARHGADIG